MVHQPLWMLVILLIAVLPAGCVSASKPTIATGTLAQARKAHATKLLSHGPSPQSYDNTMPAGVRQVYYQSAGRKLRAWVAAPAAPGKHPAVLYAHGGFCLGAEDFEHAQAFVQAGYMVLMPAWRGENGNPGQFEMLYGEVDDALAALDALAHAPSADPDRLYAAGHSVGGTLVLLLAERSPRLKKVGACGACANMRDIVERTGRAQFDETPFDWRDPLECDLRSPGLHVADLKCPAALYFGVQEGAYRYYAGEMRDQAQALGKSVTVESFPGKSHLGALDPAIAKMIRFFGE